MGGFTGQMLSVCADDGTTTLLKLGDGLAGLQPNEKSAIAQLFDKEARFVELMNEMK